MSAPVLHTLETEEASYVSDGPRAWLHHATGVHTLYRRRGGSESETERENPSRLLSLSVSVRETVGGGFGRRLRCSTLGHRVCRLIRSVSVMHSKRKQGPQEDSQFTRSFLQGRPLPPPVVLSLSKRPCQSATQKKGNLFILMLLLLHVKIK